MKFGKTIFSFVLTSLILLSFLAAPITQAQDNSGRTRGQTEQTRQTETTTTQTQTANNPTQTSLEERVAAEGSCGIGLGGFSLKSCALYISAGILSFVGVLVDLASQFFDFILELTILSGTYNENQTIINVGWFLVRDLANIVLVLAIFAIAIGTMLEIGGYTIQQALPRLLIAGLLVNFSLPLAGLVVDASNVLALGLWQGAQGTVGIYAGKSLSEVLIQGTQLPQFLFNNLGFEDILITTIFGVIFIGLFAFTLFALSFMFVLRMGALWVILLLSPAAFIAMGTPGLQGYASRWWDALIKQSFFAPAALLFIYIASKAIQNDFTVQAVTQQNQGGFGGAIILFINYAILVGILFYSLKFAQTIGDQSAALGRKYADKALGYARGGLKGIAKSRFVTNRLDRAKGNVANQVLRNRLITRSLGTVAPSSVAALGRASDARKKARGYSEEQQLKALKGRSIAEQARIVGNLSATAQTQHLAKLKDGDRADLLKELKKNNYTAYERITTNVESQLDRDKVATPENKRYGKFKKGDVAKALAATDLELAMKFEKPEILVDGKFPSDPKSAAGQQAQQATNDFVNGLNEETRGNILENLGAADSQIGKYVREYFKEHGTRKDYTKNRKRIEKSNEMLTKMLTDSGLTEDLYKEYLEDTEAVVQSLSALNLSSKEKEQRVRRAQTQFMQNILGNIVPSSGDKNWSAKVRGMEAILFNPGSVKTTPGKDNVLKELEKNLKGDIGKVEKKIKTDDE